MPKHSGLEILSLGWTNPIFKTSSSLMPVFHQSNSSEIKLKALLSDMDLSNSQITILPKMFIRISMELAFQEPRGALNLIGQVMGQKTNSKNWVLGQIYKITQQIVFLEECSQLLKVIIRFTLEI